MMNKTGFGLKGIGLGLALLFSFAATPQAGASPLGSAFHLQDATALPIVDVQARRPARPVRRNVRRNRNNAAVAGAILGAAVVGGAIIAQSEADRRERRRRAQYYYYNEPQYYYGQPRRVYRQQPQYYYYQEPRYYQPQPLSAARYQPQPRVRYRERYVEQGNVYRPQRSPNYDARTYRDSRQSGTEP